MASENVNARVTGEMQAHLQQQVGIQANYRRIVKIRKVVGKNMNRQPNS